MITAVTKAPMVPAAEALVAPEIPKVPAVPMVMRFRRLRGPAYKDECRDSSIFLALLEPLGFEKTRHGGLYL